MGWEGRIPAQGLRQRWAESPLSSVWKEKVGCKHTSCPWQPQAALPGLAQAAVLAGIPQMLISKGVPGVSRQEGVLCLISAASRK